MSRILVAAAVRQELAPFIASLNGSDEVDLLLTGIGRGRAFQAVENSLGRNPYAQVVSAGFAGGTRPGLRVGDLVIPSEVIQASTGRRFTPPVRLKCFDLTAHPELVEGERSAQDRRVEGQIAQVSRGRLVTVDQILSSPHRKEELGVRYGAVAADMETAAVAQAAVQAGVPWLAVRAILDPMEIPLEIRSWSDAAGRLALPWRWGDLLDFMKGVRLASRSLSAGLKGVIT